MNTDKPSKPKKSIEKTTVFRDHIFNVIEKHEQKRPNRWLVAFYLIITFYLGWWLVYYHTNLIKSPTERINAEMTENKNAKQKELSTIPAKFDNETLMEWSQNPKIIARGEATYKTTCIACHGADLKGGIGRSLTDDQWKYGNKPMQLLQLTLKGSPKDSKGYKGQKMQAWEDPLGRKKVAQIIAYIISKNKSVHP